MGNVQRNIRRIEQGALLSCASNVQDYEGRPSMCMVFLRKAEGRYVVEIEVFLIGNDLPEQDLRDEETAFSTLDDALAYIRDETGHTLGDFRRASR